METVMTVGSILKDPKSMKWYRVISISDTDTILCEMNTNNFILHVHNSHALIRLILDKELIKEEEDIVIFDFSMLPEKAKVSYEKKRM